MEWIDASRFSPAFSVPLVIVRCINSDMECFYFMACYSDKTYDWSFFNDDKDYVKDMQVTHWTIPDEVKEKDIYRRKINETE